MNIHVWVVNVAVCLRFCCTVNRYIVNLSLLKRNSISFSIEEDGWEYLTRKAPFLYMLNMIYWGKGGGGRRGINNRAKKGKEKISILKGSSFLLHGVCLKVKSCRFVIFKSFVCTSFSWMENVFPSGSENFFLSLPFCRNSDWSSACLDILFHKSGSQLLLHTVHSFSPRPPNTPTSFDFFLGSKFSVDRIICTSIRW